MDLAVCEKLIPQVKDGHLVVAESGIKNKEDALRMKKAGADAILVGTSIVSSDSVLDKIMELKV